MPSKTPGEGSFLPPPASMLPTIVGACQLTDATLPLSIPPSSPGVSKSPLFSGHSLMGLGFTLMISV